MRFFRKYQLQRSVITRLRLQDAAALAEVHANSFIRPWSRGDFETMLGVATNTAYGMKIGRRLIAFLLLRFAADEAEVLTLATHRAFQKLGCGEKLMGHGFGQSMAQGARYMHLEVESNNRAAVKLYEKLGFRETGRRGHYYAPSGGGDAILMSRELV
ncbi:MAG: ribosomal protein S18-alanine N-acetyltransferase [Pseudomonadota bacterium]